MTLTLLASILGWLVGCVAVNPGVPSPPAEIPLSLSFPDNVGVDLVSTGPNPENNANFLLQSLKLGSFELSLSEIIAIGPEQIRIVNDEIISGFLSPLSVFEIPVSPEVTTFEGTMVAPDSFPLSVKIDFSAFDFDGDGMDEPCTGNTCPVSGINGDCPTEASFEDLQPVCFRVWVQKDPDFPFVRILAGFFDLLPIKDDPATEEDEENPGKGTFRAGAMQSGEFESDTFLESFLLAVNYDHRVPSLPFNQRTEIFGIAQNLFNGEMQFFSNLHNSVSQLESFEPDGSSFIKKEVKSTELEEGGDADKEKSFSEYIGFFRDDKDFWSGSFNLDSSDGGQSLPTTCARISSGEAVSQEICQDLFIDSSGQSFLPLTEESQVGFPADFPESPTF